MKRDKELLKEYVDEIAYRDWHESETITTECRLLLKNGYKIVGQAQCFEPEDFDNELGKFFAMQDAMRYLRIIHGFMEHEQLHREQQSGEEKVK